MKPNFTEAVTLRVKVKVREKRSSASEIKHQQNKKVDCYSPNPLFNLLVENLVLVDPFCFSKEERGEKKKKKAKDTENKPGCKAWMFCFACV